MSKYTREQIQKARDKADDAAAKFGMSTNEERAWIDTFTEALGLDVEDEKPEPGTWHFTRTEGWPAFIGDGGDLIVVEPSGVLDFYYADHDDWPDLDPATPPARVVAAEHGHGRVEVSRDLPGRDEVEEAVESCTLYVGHHAIEEITNAVMELLEASK